METFGLNFSFSFAAAVNIYVRKFVLQGEPYLHLTIQVKRRLKVLMDSKVHYRRLMGPCSTQKSIWLYEDIK